MHGPLIGLSSECNSEHGAVLLVAGIEYLLPFPTCPEVLHAQIDAVLRPVYN